MSAPRLEADYQNAISSVFVHQKSNEYPLHRDFMDRSSKDGGQSLDDALTQTIYNHIAVKLGDYKMEEPVIDTSAAPSPGLSSLGPEAIELAARTIKISDYTDLTKGHAPPRLHHELDRVLFNPGVYRLQDARSGVFNFDPFFQKLPAAADFDLTALPAYRKPSADARMVHLLESVWDHKYIGSTSTLTRVLQQLHFTISAWRPLYLADFSQTLTRLQPKVATYYAGPTSILLRPLGKNRYAVDPDVGNSGDDVMSARELMVAGHMLEKMLTSSKSEFETFLLKDTAGGKASQAGIAKREREQGQGGEQVEDRCAYSFIGIDSFLIRSQLDAMDDRLAEPRHGMKGFFDIKTRAALPIRMDPYNKLKWARSYQIIRQFGAFESFECELFDMIRTVMFKFSAQARLGRMAGIFVAFHNLVQIFGFQYLHVRDMDRYIHGRHAGQIGPQEFKLSFPILRSILDRISDARKDMESWVHFHVPVAQDSPDITLDNPPYLLVFAELSTPQLHREFRESRNASKNPPPSGQEEHVLVNGIPQMHVMVTALLRKILPFTTSKMADHAHEEYANLILAKMSLQRYASQVEKELLSAEDSNSDFVQAKALVDEVLEATDSIISGLSDEQNQVISTLVDKLSLQTPSNAFHQCHQPEKLLALKVRLENHVDGVRVLRPTYMTDDSDWRVRYVVEEIVDPVEALSLYREMLTKKCLVSFRRDSEGIYQSKLFKVLQSISDRGKSRLKGMKKRAASGVEGPLVFRSHSGSKSQPLRQSTFKPRAKTWIRDTGRSSRPSRLSKMKLLDTQSQTGLAQAEAPNYTNLVDIKTVPSDRDLNHPHAAKRRKSSGETVTKHDKPTAGVNGHVSSMSFGVIPTIGGPKISATRHPTKRLKPTETMLRVPRAPRAPQNTLGTISDCKTADIWQQTRKELSHWRQVRETSTAPKYRWMIDNVLMGDGLISGVCKSLRRFAETLAGTSTVAAEKRRPSVKYAKFLADHGRSVAQATHRGSADHKPHQESRSANKKQPISNLKAAHQALKEQISSFFYSSSENMPPTGTVSVQSDAQYPAPTDTPPAADTNQPLMHQHPFERTSPSLISTTQDMSNQTNSSPVPPLSLSEAARLKVRRRRARNKDSLYGAFKR